MILSKEIVAIELYLLKAGKFPRICQERDEKQIIIIKSSNFLVEIVGLSVDDQAVSLSDDGTTIIIDFLSERR